MQFSVNNFLFDVISIKKGFIEAHHDGHLYEFPLDIIDKKPGNPDVRFFTLQGVDNNTPAEKPFYANLEEITIKNEAYRNVQFTDPQGKLQLVLMSLQPGQEIGREVHRDNTQFFRIEAGHGMAMLQEKSGNVKYPLENGTSVIVPAGTYHNIINTSKTEKLKLYTIYAPAHHPPGTFQQTKPLDD